MYVCICNNKEREIISNTAIKKIVIINLYTSVYVAVASSMGMHNHNLEIASRNFGILQICVCLEIP